MTQLVGLGGLVCRLRVCTQVRIYQLNYREVLNMKVNINQVESEYVYNFHHKKWYQIHFIHYKNDNCLFSH